MASSIMPCLSLRVCVRARVDLYMCVRVGHVWQIDDAPSLHSSLPLSLPASLPPCLPASLSLPLSLPPSSIMPMCLCVMGLSCTTCCICNSLLHKGCTCTMFTCMSRIYTCLYIYSYHIYMCIYIYIYTYICNLLHLHGIAKKDIWSTNKTLGSRVWS